MVAVVRVVFGHPGVDVGQQHALTGGRLDGQGDQCDIGQGGLSGLLRADNRESDTDERYNNDFMYAYMVNVLRDTTT